jgi:hypothetical protein
VIAHRRPSFSIGRPEVKVRMYRSRNGTRWIRRMLVLPAALAVVLVVPFLDATASASPAGGLLQIKVLSDRADLISGGDALVEVAGGGAGTTVRLGGADITRQFAVRADGRFTGLVTGLAVGRNDLVATRGRLGARITVTNHPNGGPVFAGPQVQPWDCTMHSDRTGLGAPVDAQCDTAPVTRFVYMPTAHTGFRPFDPAAPATDVASTTTDQGVTVPYVVRVETGTQDRGIYSVAVLFDPAKPFTPFAPQTGWNHKVMWPFGGGGQSHHTSDLPGGVLDDTSLSRGFLVATSGLNVQGSNNNDVVTAESVTMLKEHVVETYGEIRYTIGEGCSGGSIQQQELAEEYPGLLDGILPNCSFPDLWTTGTEVSDCGLLVNFFAGATGWTDAQKAAVAGTKDTSACQAWNVSFVPTSRPDLATNCGFTAGDPRVYDAVRNPGGARCEVADYQVAVWGTRPQQDWTAPEQAAGHGFAQNAADNNGVLYGLAALRSGVITPAQFTDLNATIGGFDLDGRPQAARKIGDPGAEQLAYRAGQVTEALRLDQTPMIDLRGSANINNIHTDYHSWELRARLDAAHGNHANQAIWTWDSTATPTNITPPRDIAVQAFTTMDTWLATMEADHRPLPRSVKVRLDKPGAVVDACWPNVGAAGVGPEVTDPDYRGACGQRFPHFSDARAVAGQRESGITLKCTLAPLRRADLPGVTDEQFARLHAALPGGACDWNRAPVGFALSQPWLTFAGGPGGRPLGFAPVSLPFIDLGR